jgi:restriction system protein
MGVPDYQSLMLPVLRSVADGKDHGLAEIRSAVALAVDLTDEDLGLTIPSGKSLANSRIDWALTYLQQAGLLRRVSRGTYQLSSRGKVVLDQGHATINNNLLARYPEFLEFMSRTRQKQQSRVRKTQTATQTPALTPAMVDVVAKETPSEQLAQAVEEAHTAVATELLDRILGREPAFLEKLVLQLLTAMGYGGRAGAVEHLGRPGDKGLDGVIRQDVLGLDRVYIQAKRYDPDRPVGGPDLYSFAGALQGARANRGVFITTSRFTQDAKAYTDQSQLRIVLIDGVQLTDLMILYNVGVQEEQRFTLKRVDEDFFDDSL